LRLADLETSENNDWSVAEDYMTFKKHCITLPATAIRIMFAVEVLIHN